MGSGYSKRKKQAKVMQQQFQQMQEKMKELRVTATSGGDLVSVTMNGDGEIVELKIKPDCVDPDDIEGLEDLVMAACNDANKKVKKESQMGMPDLSNLGGLGL